MDLKYSAGMNKQWEINENYLMQINNIVQRLNIL